MLLALFTFNLTAQNTKKYPSRFWEITGNGLTKPSYLYGTMHVSKKLAYYLPDTFFVALKNVDIVALETNVDKSLDEMINSDLFAIANKTYSNYGASNFYKNAFQVTVPKREDYAQLLAADPDLVNEMMFRFSDMLGRGDFEESTYLDLFIYQCGKRLNKKSTGLETFDGAMKYYLKAVNPENAKIERKEKKNDTSAVVEEETEDYTSENNTYKQIEDAYRAGDLDLLDSLDKKTYPTKLYGKYLIDDRNLVMLNNMDSIMKKESLFTGVGAGHLPGKDGLIELLRKKGYTVRPISLDKMKTAGQTKDKLEAIRMPLTFNTFTTDDNIFSVDVPNKMYEVYVFDELKQYLCVDAANASYYTVYRIKSHNEFGDYDMAINKKRLDSLFYEFIPGKILTKKEITKNGYQGFDITTKTQRGDVRRYEILITPLEIFIFKAAGIGDYFLAKENEQFFNSIKLNIVTDKWKTYQPEFGGYEAQLPAYTIFDKKIKNVKNTKKYEKTFAYDADGNYYQLMRADYPDYSYIEEDTFELAYLTEVFNNELKYEVVSRKFTTQDKHPAFETTLKTEKGKYVFLKTVVNGPHYYMLGVVSDKNNYPTTFFNSLKFTKSNYQKPFFTYNDTSYHYTVTTCVKPFEDEVINYASYNSLARNNYYTEEKKPFESFVSHKTYENPYNLEEIYVGYEKFHDYLNINNVDSFWNSEIEYYTKRNNLHLSKSNKSVVKDQTTYDIMLTDTNSTRGIMVKIIVKHGRMYYVDALIDTISGPSEFVQKFFTTFTPTDTLIGLSAFVNKSDLFFSALESADSSKRKEAVKALDFMRFRDKEDANRFIKFFKSAKYYNYNVDERIDIIDGFSSVKDKKVLPFLVELYDKSGDTSNLQFNILNDIAQQKNKDAIKVIDSILTNNAPIPSTDYETSKIFYPLYDSLKLAVNLFPNLLKLTKYDEYKDKVYGLFTSLIDSNLIPTAKYLDNKNDLLREANETLKRYNSKEQKNEIAKKKKEDEDDDDNKYSYSSDVDTYEERDMLSSFLRILMPFYNEPNVKVFYDKLAKVKNDDLLMDLNTQMLIRKIPVNDTMWTHFAKDPETRFPLYKKLKDVKRLDAFPKAYNSQVDIAQSLLKLDGYSEDKDTITYVDKRRVNTKSDSGYVYFFKCYYSKEKRYVLDYVGLMPLDTTKIKTDFNSGDDDYSEYSARPYHSQGVKWKDAKLEELKAEILTKFRLEGRERVQLYNSNREESIQGADDDY
jgi:uncharacterized protein YbaP (TraB family)